MKNFFTLIAAVLFTITVTAQNNQQSLSQHALKTKKSNSTLDGSVEDWYVNAQQYIIESEYYFKPYPQVPGIMYGANRKQKIGFFIDQQGFKISPLQFSEKADPANQWSQSVGLMQIKRGEETFKPTGKVAMYYNSGNLIYNYPQLSIQYINNNDGLRQNFIINEKLLNNTTDSIEVLLQVNGDLKANVTNNSLQFTNTNGAVKFVYTDLKVWDATNKVLSATMKMYDNNVVALVVDDKDAQYPITIDPINQTPEWTTSADGVLPTVLGSLAVDAAYGFSVAGLGDINGDGFDDVAVGAPALVDIVSGTGTLASVGAVFIYYGNNWGLPTAPGSVLQPTTCIAGALFGYSIAGGDVNNDGKNDVIVGAPLDKVTISTGGSSTASGTVGKVYVFNGATLSTTTTPLFTLQLSGNGILENGVNLSVNALFGFSVAVTEDLNGDNKRDMIVGAPTYAGIKAGFLGASLLDVQSGGAFVFLTNAANNNTTLVKLEPYKSSLLGLPVLSNNITGLLFGYAVDGVGDYNNDGKADVIATAPAGVDVSSLGALLNGKLLQGSALVYYGTGTGINTSIGATLAATSGGLLTNLTGTLSNTANMFGMSVKGVKNAVGNRNGNILVGAPLGGVLTNVLSLQLKAGTINLFKKKTGATGNIIPTQIINSPRNSNTILGVIQANLLFGFSMDNILDVNCDGYADIIVGEPASSGVQLLNANVAGGAAYVYLGKADGTYQTSPAWTLTATEDAFLGVNATSLIGYSVAGAGRIRGAATEPRVLTGSPSRTLDFGSGLLNLGSTLGTIFSLTSGDNGVGKAYLFNTNLCSVGGPLPVKLTALKGVYTTTGTSRLSWSTASEMNSHHFDLQRSNDGVHFVTIAMINAAGYSSSMTDYNFEDATINAGNNYYRLKMVDNNGSYEYSNVVMLQVKIKGFNVTSVYPSPFVNQLTVSIAAENKATADIRLIDNTGKVVVSQQNNITPGINNVMLTGLNSLAKGMYVIQVRNGDKVMMQKIVKQ